MKTKLLLAWSLTFSTLLNAENEIGFIEKFALSPNREAVMNELIPGSEDYYFYHALQYQNTNQEEKLAGIMRQWAKRFPRSEQRRVIENRSALLRYDTDPTATLKFLRDRLHLHFDDQQETRNKRPDLPCTLDQGRVSRAVFLREALRRSDDLKECSDETLERLVRDKTPLRTEQARALLARIKRPDVPNLIELAAEDLQSKESRGFGEFDIHRALLPEQMDDLARRIPSLLENTAFITARIAKMAPGADADAEFDPAERVAWLERVWSYTSKLPPAFNSLKANILYQRLKHDQGLGVYDENRFLEYLKLPRPEGYMNPKYLMGHERNTVDLNTDYTGAMSTAVPIGDDERLARDFFLHIFEKADGTADPAEVLKPWTPYARESWLRPILAEAMITNGKGEPERWASLLSPSAFQALKDRVDVDFAATNPQFCAPADGVKIDVSVKNAPKLIVRVYEINTLSYFLTQKRQLNTDLQLDGLVPKSETTIDLGGGESDNPFRRVTRSSEFPELKGKRGAWVIEYIGGGKSSRALVRKGHWSLIQRIGPAGDMLTVLDEQQNPVKDVVAWLEGRKLLADAKTGYIVVPFAKEAGSKQIILATPDGEFATLANFAQHTENYRLDAQFHIEREQLIAGRQATLAVRAALLIGDEQTSLELLKQTKLAITSTTLDGVSTTAEIPDPVLTEAKTFTHVFQVPERLASLSVTLNGKVENISKGGEKQEVSATRTWEINGIDRTDATSDGQLSKFDKGYVFELLGKNGEPIANQQVVFDFTNRGFTEPEHIALRTDDAGRIQLGALAELSRAQARLPNGRVRDWALEDSARTWPTTIHANAGDPIEIPRAGDPGSYSLLEQRGGTFVADKKEAIEGAGGAEPMINGLAPGDYSLLARDAGLHEITIRVTAGKRARNWIASPTRSLEAREGLPLQIAGAQVDGDSVRVRIANADQFTRVHIAATRFLPGTGLFELGRFARFEPGWGTPDKLPNLFAAEREIGDEYRYILERRDTKAYPGNMLARPGLLLNPWEERSTDLHALESIGGEISSAMGGARAGQSQVPSAIEGFGMDAAHAADGADIDYLANTAPVFYNLTPDENGIAHLDRKELGDRQYLQIEVENLTGAVERTMALPEVLTKLHDLRLMLNLDPGKTFTEKKEATLLEAGQKITLDNILTSDLETYDSLASVHALFMTLSHDERLAKFGWVLDWPKLKDEEKRARYSEYACHELNVFLARKDPSFFTSVIVPHLRNKKDKTFIDDYLLGADMKRYAAPWAYGRLNIAERCLLAERLPDEAAATARHLRELWELLPPNPERNSQMFDTALMGDALFKEDKSGLSDARRGLVASSEPSTPVATTAPAPAGFIAYGSSLKRSNSYSGSTSIAGGVITMGDLAQTPRQFRTKARRPYLRDGVDAPGNEQKNELSIDADSGSLNHEESKRLRTVTRQFFRALGPTKEWAENNYYELPLSQQGAELITINAFWRDYAGRDPKTPFLSTHVAEASGSFSEMMLALAVLDLPFNSPKNVQKTEGSRFTMTAGGPLIAFHREIKLAAPARDREELLVSENFYRQGDRYREEGNERFDKYVTEEFLPGVVYRSEHRGDESWIITSKTRVADANPSRGAPGAREQGHGQQSATAGGMHDEDLRILLLLPHCGRGGLSSLPGERGAQ